MRVLQVQSERAQAESSADFLERWAAGTPVDATAQPLHIGEVAILLNTTTDAVRNWERNRLIQERALQVVALLEEILRKDYDSPG
jgi:hypothetical protein